VLNWLFGVKLWCYRKIKWPSECCLWLLSQTRWYSYSDYDDVHVCMFVSGVGQSGQRCCLLVTHLLVVMVLLVGLMAVVLSLLRSSTMSSYDNFHLYASLHMHTDIHRFSLLYILSVKNELPIMFHSSHWHVFHVHNESFQCHSIVFRVHYWFIFCLF